MANHAHTWWYNEAPFSSHLFRCEEKKLALLWMQEGQTHLLLNILYGHIFSFNLAVVNSFWAALVVERRLLIFRKLLQHSELIIQYNVVSVTSAEWFKKSVEAMLGCCYDASQGCRIHVQIALSPNGVFTVHSRDWRGVCVCVLCFIVLAFCRTKRQHDKCWPVN